MDSNCPPRLPRTSSSSNSAVVPEERGRGCSCGVLGAGVVHFSTTRGRYPDGLTRESGVLHGTRARCLDDGRACAT